MRHSILKNCYNEWYFCQLKMTPKWVERRLLWISMSLPVNVRRRCFVGTLDTVELSLRVDELHALYRSESQRCRSSRYFAALRRLSTPLPLLSLQIYCTQSMEKGIFYQGWGKCNAEKIKGKQCASRHAHRTRNENCKSRHASEIKYIK